MLSLMPDDDETMAHDTVSPRRSRADTVAPAFLDATVAPPMSSTHKILLLGAGRIGQVHAKNVAFSPRAKLHAVVDVNADAAKKLAQEYGAKTYATADEALADKEITAVMICTSTDTHTQMIEKCVAQKLPTFCEKPVDLSMAKVTACLDAVKKSGAPLMMGFNRRFDPSFQNVRDRVRAGELGDVEVVRITSRDPSPPPPAYVKVSGGLFRDMMIHDLDMARYLLGDDPVVSVYASASVLVDKAIGEAGDVDTAVVVLKTAKGKLCTIDNSRRAAYGYDQRIEVFGQKGALLAGNPTATAVTALGAGGTISDKPHHFFLERYAEAYQRELAHFLDVVEGKAQPLVTGEDGKKALALADACNESLAKNAAVEVRL
jgi:myo-inositol 2-dehydrogenase/D-chiro-inositol 1-dehydrogenase